MNEQNNNIKEKDDYTFLQEKIKDRPINKKKIFKQSLITSATAVVFAFTACCIFFFIEKNHLDRQNEIPPEKITITLQETTEEIVPSELPMEEDINSSENEPAADPFPISDAVVKYDFEVSDYQSVITKMRNIALTTNKSLVSVTAITDSMDWLNNPYESTAKSTGILISDNGTDLLILVPSNVISDANEIQVSFFNTEEAIASVKSVDEYTNLAVITVPMTDLHDTTLASITYASFGNSVVSSKVGDIVIATGDPLGYGSSIDYGIITSTGNEVNTDDYNFSLITTNIYGSVNANGVLVNQHGKIVGIIDQSHNRSEYANQISAIGMHELKEVIENLCNDTIRPHMGLTVTDIPSAAKSYYQIPNGAYVKGIRMDSPALASGIHKGDVITAINDAVIYNVLDYENELKSYAPGDTVVVTVMRKNGDAYVDMDIKVTLI